MLNILWRNMKWRFENPLSIVFTIIQPLLWLVMYSTVASHTMQDLGIQNYTAFILPGIIVLVIFGACCSCGFINFIMRSNGSFYRILIAPINRKSIILGQMLEAILVSFLEIAILYVVSLFFSVRIETGLIGILLIILLIFMTGFFMSGLSYYMSLLLPNEVIYETIMNSIVLPLFFLSTALFPLEGLTGTLRTIVLINPFTHIINVLRSLIIGNTILFSDILPVILLFIVMCALSFLLAIWRLKKETAN
ncbi:ABC transporter permease [Clostridium peptidivorans]|uniref:ABC transporter permease n=1 Tax=Clostridium peptidivorans TaxID=100174 RepID=UPI000BE37323|nr:ABC transporter permease [Clostridium peptidivorans]